MQGSRFLHPPFFWSLSVNVSDFADPDSSTINSGVLLTCLTLQILTVAPLIQVYCLHARQQISASAFISGPYLSRYLTLQILTVAPLIQVYCLHARQQISASTFISGHYLSTYLTFQILTVAPLIQVYCQCV
ncbi:hypothetical protein BsWGS_16215 [Bradybaena similaris]